MLEAKLGIQPEAQYSIKKKPRNVVAFFNVQRFPM